MCQYTNVAIYLVTPERLKVEVSRYSIDARSLTAWMSIISYVSFDYKDCECGELQRQRDSALELLAKA